MDALQEEMQVCSATRGLCNLVKLLLKKNNTLNADSHKWAVRLHAMRWLQLDGSEELNRLRCGVCHRLWFAPETLRLVYTPQKGQTQNSTMAMLPKIKSKGPFFCPSFSWRCCGPTWIGTVHCRSCEAPSPALRKKHRVDVNEKLNTNLNF